MDKEFYSKKSYRKHRAAIYKNPNTKCFFYEMLQDAGEITHGCVCPLAIWKCTLEKSVMILSCPKTTKDCKYYQNQEKDDFIYIKRYIEHFSKNGEIMVEYHHRKKLYEKIKFRNYRYFESMLLFFGYRREYPQKNLDTGILYTNLPRKVRTAPIGDIIAKSVDSLIQKGKLNKRKKHTKKVV